MTPWPTAVPVNIVVVVVRGISHSSVCLSEGPVGTLGSDFSVPFPAEASILIFSSSLVWDAPETNSVVRFKPLEYELRTKHWKFSSLCFRFYWLKRTCCSCWDHILAFGMKVAFVTEPVLHSFEVKTFLDFWVRVVLMRIRFGLS